MSHSIFKLLGMHLLMHLSTACSATYPHLLQDKYARYYDGAVPQLISLNIFLTTGCGSTYLTLDTSDSRPGSITASF